MTRPPRVGARPGPGELRLPLVEEPDRVRPLQGAQFQREVAVPGAGMANLATFVQELNTELGPGGAGLLSRQEGRELPSLQTSPSLPISSLPTEVLAPPTRVLQEPVEVLGKLARGSRVKVEGKVFIVQKVLPVDDSRGVFPYHGEHLIVWLTHGDSGIFSWVTRDRRTKQILLCGWFT